jgi:hypothetical protein
LARSSTCVGVIASRPFLVAAQVEEQLALGLGRGDLDQAPVLQDVFVHLGLDPVHRVRHQAHALVRVETLDGLHQADIAFLDQVGVRQAIAQVAARDRHHQAQVRQHQLLRGVQVVRFPQALGQRDLFLVGQHRQAVDRRNIRVDIAEIASETQSQRTTAGEPMRIVRTSFIFLVE